MTLTLMSLLVASKSGSIFRNASFRLLAAAIVTVSGAACTDGAVQTVVVNTPRNNRHFNSTLRRVMEYLLVIVMKFIIRLEIELVLNIDAVFDQVSSESWLVLKWKPVRGSPAASHCKIGIVHNQPVVVRAIKAIAQGGAEFFSHIV